MHFSGLLFAVRGGARKKKRKQAKPPKANWFERLTVEEIKQLCRAAKLPVSGSKPDIVSRLLDSDATSHFGSESRAGGFSWRTGRLIPGKDGVSVEDLKEEMRKRSLPVSGSKHALVLRLLQHEHGTADAAGSASGRAPRANPAAAAVATAHDAEGNPIVSAPPKPRKPKAPARPNLEKLRGRIENKLYPASKSGWSNYKYKQHLADVCDLARTIIEKEGAKNFAAVRDPVILDVCLAVLEPIAEAWNDAHVTGQGRCSFELRAALEVAKDEAMTSDHKEDAFAERGRRVRDVCAEIEAKFKEYCGCSLDAAMF